MHRYDLNDFRLAASRVPEATVLEAEDGRCGLDLGGAFLIYQDPDLGDFVVLDNRCPIDMHEDDPDLDRLPPKVHARHADLNHAALETCCVLAAWLGGEEANHTGFPRGRALGDQHPVSVMSVPA